jgi:tRNA threonylcarbamoyladenosine biosynthesis protein TsaB
MTGDWLILETSGRVGQVGLARAGRLVRSAPLDHTRSRARDLAQTIEAVLRAEGLRADQLTGVMVGRGPGSYTGLRVGLISAKVLAYATGCRLVAVDTFAALAEQVPPDVEEVWVLSDALRGNVYRQRFCRTASGMRAADELRIEPFTAWAAQAAGAWVTGPGATAYAQQMPGGSRLVPEPVREPLLSGVFAAGCRTTPCTRDEVFSLEPLYLRPSSAEEKDKAGGA